MIAMQRMLFLMGSVALIAMFFISASGMSVERLSVSFGQVDIDWAKGIVDIIQK
jgi:hypothetical protein